MDCSFCVEFARVDTGDRIITHDADWVLLPTLGCFTPGYCLLMPLDHFDAVADICAPTSLSAGGAVERMRATITRIYGPTIVAEHGPRGCELGASCCSHAHLHLIPVPDPDAVTAAYRDVGGAGIALSGLDALSGAVDGPYLYLSARPGEHYLWPATGFRRQFVRQVCATQYGLDGQYDWRDHPFVERQQATLRKLRYVFARPDAA